MKTIDEIVAGLTPAQRQEILRMVHESLFSRAEGNYNEIFRQDNESWLIEDTRSIGKPKELNRDAR